MDSLGPPTPFRGRKVMDQKALVPGNPAFQRAERTAMKPSVHTQPSEGQACRTDTWRDWSPHAGSRSPWDSIGTQVLPVMDPLTLAEPPPLHPGFKRRGWAHSPCPQWRLLPRLTPQGPREPAVPASCFLSLPWEGRESMLPQG
ncbi:uncharacterized protein LOC123783281 isoform X2 [Ursus americanus]|uniref:uncharacterized protein LOC123783281 isoform X2 n=1 Tax=Ursus americanus TaxID=9643 RepID=UPI001E67B38E|nr:uncharacterized protein LOC123783281 isoform X2 [Ursus americanus]